MEKILTLKVDSTLIELLREHADMPFSTTDIRDFYILQVPEDKRPNRNQLRKYIYKELLRLESANLIERHRGSSGRGCKFIFCPERTNVELEVKPSPYGSPHSHNDGSTMDGETQRALREELCQRRVELVASIGEAEEYQRLYNKYPALRYAVREQYLESRERSTRLVGQLRAVEVVISKIGFPA